MIESHRSRLYYQGPWHQGLAVGAGSVEGACKHVIQARFTREGIAGSYKASCTSRG